MTMSFLITISVTHDSRTLTMTLPRRDLTWSLLSSTSKRFLGMDDDSDLRLYYRSAEAIAVLCDESNVSRFLAQLPLNERTARFYCSPAEVAVALVDAYNNPPDEAPPRTTEEVEHDMMTLVGNCSRAMYRMRYSPEAIAALSRMVATLSMGDSRLRIAQFQDWLIAFDQATGTTLEPPSYEKHDPNRPSSSTSPLYLSAIFPSEKNDNNLPPGEAEIFARHPLYYAPPPPPPPPYPHPPPPHCGPPRGPFFHLYESCHGIGPHARPPPPPPHMHAAGPPPPPLPLHPFLSWMFPTPPFPHSTYPAASSHQSKLQHKHLKKQQKLLKQMDKLTRRQFKSSSSLRDLYLQPSSSTSSSTTSLSSSDSSSSRPTSSHSSRPSHKHARPTKRSSGSKSRRIRRQASASDLDDDFGTLSLRDSPE